GVLQLGGGVTRAAHFAVVAVLVLGAALRALALDIAVGQEHLLHRVVELLNRAAGDQATLFQRTVNVLTVGTVFRAVGAVVVIEADVEATELAALQRLDAAEEIARVFAIDALDQLFWRDAFLFGAQHDRRAVGVVSADIV